MKKFNRLTVKVYAWFAKPLNGSSGTSSFLMKGGDISYQYQGKSNVKVSDLEDFLQINKDSIYDDFNDLRVKAEGKKPEAKIQLSILKEERGSSRVVKGIRGAIRHSVMRILHENGVAYCSPTQKETFQGSGESTLLEGEHLMGGCGETPCPVRQLFGMLGEKSPIRVWSDVLVQTDKPLDKIMEQKGLSFVHVSTENRHQARRDGKPLQDFSEQYFSGEFRFHIEFSELPQWLSGLLLEGVLGIRTLGGGVNSGYGRLEIREVAYEQVSFERTLGSENNGSVTIVEEEQTTTLNHKLSEWIDAWKNYNN